MAAIFISIIGFIGQWYLLGYRVRLIEKWIIADEASKRDRAKEMAALTEIGVKLTVLNEQVERRIHVLEGLLIIQNRNTL